MIEISPNSKRFIAKSVGHVTIEYKGMEIKYGFFPQTTFKIVKSSSTEEMLKGQSFGL